MNVVEEDNFEDNDNEGRMELNKLEVELCKQNFSFYEKNRGGPPVERFELPMLLVACGYDL
eukprot:CAMPEP_0176365842 /NCGR_PEP_ID=MMETSP0126-20121128/20758_1 /TAXON_ID=141414 ORGANISM="Strombidinopsis acuminatum, Strain SPMC142" /NCGR_SAMPLE_ID=MMETSP0126 /ASSEMBLY_ACC=CAM_ASM_000229 /LENGTH=60 /DNA_ID=CAMNT_0017723015 /DNA_START=35 /DNA_END=217 /DNA_ORIENTATION=-